MKITEYFEKKKGRGVIATADSEGRVGVAVYARPHFIDEKTVAFIMADRLMHKNVQSNPHAAYLFLESGDRYVGKRLYLTKIKEEKNSALIDKIRRRESCPVYDKYQDKTRYLVYFHVDKVLPLIGAKK
jgi:predicted pyridoxine 5'-phosphate oxidase superfamily flavin-nucleotide-binding protein